MFNLYYPNVTLYHTLALPKYKSPLDDTDNAPLTTVGNVVNDSNDNVFATWDAVTADTAADALVTVPTT